MSQRPPLRSLVVFEAAARCGSFSKAGQELGITTSAVSHQIRLLETFLGRPLFVRLNRGVQLSIEGASYLESVRDAYELIDAGTQRLLGRPVVESLVVRCGVSFGMRWLMPRIPLFLSEFPEIDLQVVTPSVPRDSRSPPVDVEIRYGVADQPGMRVEPLFEENVLPLCSPSLLKGRHMLREPKDLAAFRLIDSDISVINWAHFLSVNRIALEGFSRLKFDNILLALQAAASGLGIALEGEFLAGEELATGRLIVPPALRGLTIRKPLRSLVTPEIHPRSDKIDLFREWLHRMLGADREAVK